MKKILLIFSVLAIVSCSKDDSTETTTAETTPEVGKHLITGKFLAPNNFDPIVNATASLLKDETIIAETFTSVEGNYSFEMLTAGTYTVQLEKGKFTSTDVVEVLESEDPITFEMGNIQVQNFPKIGVVKGSFDNIESILFDMGLVNPITNEPLFDIIDDVNGRMANQQHGHQHTKAKTDKIANEQDLPANVDFSFEDLLADPAQLEEYDILFLNCGLDTNLDTNGNLHNYVSNGGILYATDWAFEYLENINAVEENEYLIFVDPAHSGISVTTEATILNDDLSNWLILNFGINANGTVTIDEFLSSWQVVETYDETQVIPWLNGEIEYGTESGTVIANKDLAFTYSIGNGGVFYSSFHTENHDAGFSDVDRIMEYLVFELSTLSVEQ